MSGREHYTPGPAGRAEVRQEGEKWVLVMTAR